MRRRAPGIWLGSLLLSKAVLAQEPTCRERAAAAGTEVYGFEAPPPVPDVLRLALHAGRAWLQEGAKLAPRCTAGTSLLTSGYVVASLSQGQVSFSAPEPLPAALEHCLRRVVRQLPRPPTLGMASVAVVWPLHAPRWDAPPAAEPAPGPRKRSFAEIQAAVKPHLPGLASCLEALWAEQPLAAGTLVLRLTVEESGAVAVVETLRAEPALRSAEPCLFDIMGRVHFPPRPGLGRTVMSYPLVLSAPAS